MLRKRQIRFSVLYNFYLFTHISFGGSCSYAKRIHWKMLGDLLRAQLRILVYNQQYRFLDITNPLRELQTVLRPLHKNIRLLKILRKICSMLLTDNRSVHERHSNYLYFSTKWMQIQSLPE